MATALRLLRATKKAHNINIGGGLSLSALKVKALTESSAAAITSPPCRYYLTGNGSSSSNSSCKYSSPLSPSSWSCLLGSSSTSTQLLVTNQRYYARLSTKSSAHCANKTDTKASSTTASDLFGDSAHKGLFAKFKHMYKQYWYVLIPVHVLTSVGWFGGFYYLSKSGVDVPSLLQYIHLSETIIEKVQGSDMGHYAIAYLCYKVATPLRYALTLGGTTISIKYLVQAGHIKPIPTKRQLIKMYEEKKATRASARADKAEKESGDSPSSPSSSSSSPSSPSSSSPNRK